MHVGKPKNLIPHDIHIGKNQRGELYNLTKEDLHDAHVFMLGLVGMGKSVLISQFLQQVIGLDNKVVFIEPIGGVYNRMKSYIAYHMRKAYLKGEKEYKWFLENVASNIVFIDLTDPETPWRYNILEPVEDANENLFDVVNRILLFFDMNHSNDGGGEGMDLQLERRQNIAHATATFSFLKKHIGEMRSFITNQEKRKKILDQASQSNEILVLDAVEHFQSLFKDLGMSKATEKLNSMRTALSPFHENEILRKFLFAKKSNFSPYHMMTDNKSYFIKVPTDSLAIQKLLYNVLYSGFFSYYTKRGLNAKPMYLGSDESSLVMTTYLRDTMTRSRNYKVHFLNITQSYLQMQSEDRIRACQNIEMLSACRIYFRPGCLEDAEHITDETIPLFGKMLKEVELTTQVSRSVTENTGTTVSEGKSEQDNIGIRKNLSDTFSENHTESFSITDSMSITNSIQNTWSEGESLGETETFNVGNSFSYSQNTTNGWQKIEGKNISFTWGEGKSLMRGVTEAGTITFAESEGTSETNSSSKGFSESEGSGESFSFGTGANEGMGFSMTSGGDGVAIIEGVPTSTGRAPTETESKTMSSYKNEAKSQSKNKSSAWNTVDGIANSVSRAINRGTGKSHGKSRSITLSAQQNAAFAQSFSKAESLALGYARAIQKSLGHTEGFSRSRNRSHGFSEGTALSQARAYSQATARGISYARSIGFNLSEGYSQGTSFTVGKSTGLSCGITLAVSMRNVYYPITEERRIIAQKLIRLPRQHCLISVAGNAELIRIAYYYEYPYAYGDLNFLKILDEHNLKKVTGESLEHPKKFPNKPIEDFRIYPADFGDFLP